MVAMMVMYVASGTRVHNKFLNMRRAIRLAAAQSPHNSSRPRLTQRIVDFPSSLPGLRLSSVPSFACRAQSNHHCQSLKSNDAGTPFRVSRRSFARSSGPSDETPEDKARTFVIGIGHEPEIAQGVVDALTEGGLSGEALLATVRSMAGRWEVGEDEGLEALVASVKQNLALTEGKSMVTIYCVPPNAWSSGEEDTSGADHEEQTEEERQIMMSRAFPVEALDGTTITDVAKFGEGEGAATLGEYIECACSGIMACSTCHVVIDSAWIDKVGKAEEDEQDMIDLAYSPRDNSRLGCQVVITKDLEGMVIRLPKGANNLMDFVPFE